MSDVTVYGKQGCPYTSSALKDLDSRGIAYTYVDVKADKSALEEMLAKSGGRRVVPVIVEGDAVTIGFGGT